METKKRKNINEENAICKKHKKNNFDEKKNLERECQNLLKKMCELGGEEYKIILKNKIKNNCFFNFNVIAENNDFIQLDGYYQNYEEFKSYLKSLKGFKENYADCSVQNHVKTITNKNIYCVSCKSIYNKFEGITLNFSEKLIVKKIKYCNGSDYFILGRIN